MSAMLHHPPTMAANLTTMPSVLKSQPFAHELSPLIGPARNSYTVRNGFDMKKDFITVAENHENRVEILAVFLGNLFRRTENQFVFSLFDLKEMPDRNWKVITYHFDSYVAEQRPSQVAPPLGQFSSTETTGTLLPYRFAVETLIDPMKNPEGQMIQYAQTVQCLQAFTRALESLVLTSMINVRAYYLQYWMEASDFRVDLVSRVATDLVTFDFMHRNENAAATLLNMVQDSFDQSQRGKCNAVIVPQGWRSLAVASPTYTEFYRRGDGSKEYSDLLADAPGLQGVIPGTDVKLYVASPVNATGQGVFYNVLYREVEIGGCGCVDNYGFKFNADEYRSTMTDITMFDMTDGNFRTITALDCGPKCCRFDTSDAGNLLPSIKTLAKEAVQIAGRHKLTIVNNVVDMFVYCLNPSIGTQFSDTTHWGHCESWALTPLTIANHAVTMRRFLLSKFDAKQYERYRTGEQTAKRLFNLPISDEDVAFAKASQPNKPTTNLADGHFTGGAALYDSVTLVNGNVPKAVVGVTDRVGTYEPRFFGYPPNMIALAQEDPAKFPYVLRSVFDDAQGYYAGVEIMFDALFDVYGEDHPMLSSAYTPANFMTSLEGDYGDRYKRLMTFAVNILGKSANTIQLKGGAGAVWNGQAIKAPYDAITNSTFVPGGGAPNVVVDWRIASSANVRRVFESNTSIDVFVNKFDNGPMGAAYRAFIAERNRMSATPTLPVQVIQRPFEDFFLKEVLPRLKKAPAGASRQDFDNANRFSSWALSQLMSHIISATDMGTQYTFAKETLDGLVSQTNFASYESALATTSDPASGEWYNTRLVAAPERIIEYQNKKGANAEIRIASPINPAAGVKPAIAFGSVIAAQQAQSSTDIAANVISTQARMTSLARVQPRVPFSVSVGSAPFSGFADIGRDIVIDSYGRSMVKTNDNLATRVTEIQKRSDTLERIAALMLITAPVQWRAIAKMYEKNIHMPIAFICVRPRRVYGTVGMIFLAVNKNLGIAAWCNADVRRGMDATRKKYFDHWSCDLGAVVIDPARILTVPDTAIVAYKGGETMDPVKPPRLDNPNPKAMQEERGSMYYIAVPAGSCVGRERSLPPWFDITGRFPYQITAQRIVDAGSVSFAHQSKPHYLSAIHTCHEHKFDQAQFKAAGKEIHFTANSRRNTAIGHEFAYVNLPGGNWAVPPTDLMGQYVYFGAKTDRTSGNVPRLIKPQNAQVQFVPNA